MNHDDNSSSRRDFIRHTALTSADVLRRAPRGSRFARPTARQLRRDRLLRSSGRRCAVVRFHWTFAVTLAFPFSVNVHVLVLLPLLEQAPDQIASRPLVTLSEMDVPVANDADPVVPTLTLIPAGLDVTRSPLRPVAVTVSVAPCDGGFTVNVAVRVTPL